MKTLLNRPSISCYVRWFRGPSGGIFLGLLIAFSAGLAYLGGGIDAYTRFFRPYPPPDLPNPNWVFLVTAPFGWIPWPVSFVLWNLLTMFAARYLHFRLGYRYWWVAVASVPMVMNLWMGNLELLPISGTLAAMLILQKKAHPAWWGLAVLALLNKPQVGLGLMLLLTYWIWKDFGFKSLIAAGVTALATLGLTWIFWPGWMLPWLTTLVGSTPLNAWFNGSIFPYGLIAWPFALLPLKIDRTRRLRMVAAATLLGNPYLTDYHTATLFVVSENPWLFGLFWLLFALRVPFNYPYIQLIWLIPAAVLAIDLYAVLRHKPAPESALEYHPAPVEAG